MLKLIIEVKDIIFIMYYALFLFLNEVINLLLFYPSGLTLSIVLIIFLYYAFYIYLNALYEPIHMVEYYWGFIDHFSNFFLSKYRYISIPFCAIFNILY